MATVFLNIDAGELSDEPDALFESAHVVSIACGGHTGDAATMDRALAACLRYGTAPGAHPSYLDGFGRRHMAVAPGTLERQVADQIAALVARAEAMGARVEYVKPHGALYHAAHADDAVARVIVSGAASVLPSFTLIGPAHGALERAAGERRLLFAREGFADRRVRPDGSLVPRGEPGALETDPNRAAKRAAELALSGLVDTICVHGDTPGAAELARAVRREIDGIPR